jgi:hypothetical protein
MSGAAFEAQSRGGALTVAGIKHAPRYWSPEETETLTRLRGQEGLPVRAIAKALNRSRQSVAAKIAILGIELPDTLKRGQGVGLPLRVADKVRRYWMRGQTVEGCARDLGLFEARVARAYRQFSAEEREAAALASFIGTYVGAKEMMAIVAPVCGVKAAAISGQSRLKPFICARVAIARALKDRGLSATVIARALGRTDHTTALHWFKLFEPYCTAYPETLRAYQAIKDAERRASERLAA